MVLADSGWQHILLLMEKNPTNPVGWMKCNANIFKYRGYTQNFRYWCQFHQHSTSLMSASKKKAWSLAVSIAQEPYVIPFPMDGT